ncbi:hypothetical protein ABTF56_20345, partial [Acinetobacter baumannii]
RLNSKARLTRLRYHSAGYTSCSPVDLDEGTGVCVSDQSLLHADSIGLDNSLSRKIVSGEWQHTVMAGGSFTRTRLLRYSDTSNSNVI